jgi:hypothetical protein
MLDIADSDRSTIVEEKGHVSHSELDSVALHDNFLMGLQQVTGIASCGQSRSQNLED